ncbi:MAG: outer membrane beta-barrel protein [Verrucomicrobia bacterium]|nr:outer membrane beta-barrel protein [Verrucomicrobiota bacterium]
MKNIIASAGIIAVGTVSLQAAYAPGLTPQEAAKPWSVAATLRGFYDDNYSSSPKAYKPDGLFGVDFRPSAAYNLQLEQTLLSLQYEYGLKYYFDREGRDYDQSHQVDGKIHHSFAERLRMRISDSFVYAQEPELIDVHSGVITAYRSKADAFRNNASIDFTADLTEVVSANVGYFNGFYDYKEDGAGSYSALLDRMVHRMHLDGSYLVREDTRLGLGYAYWINDYRSKDRLAATANALRGNDRDNTSHVIYALAEHHFTPKAKGDIRIGAQFVDFDESEFSDSWAPFVELNGYYYYLPGSYMQLGMNVQRTTIDTAGGAILDDPTTPVDEADYITDQEAVNIIASINHRITPQLTGSVLGQYQFGRFEGEGQYDGDVDNWFALGVNLEYRINSFWSAEAGYNFDRVDSDESIRSFSRNRVYGGVRAQY